MHASALRCLVVAAGVIAALPCGAEVPDGSGCEIPGAELNPLSDRAGLLARYERLPQACLEEIVVACSEAASRTLLDFGSAAACSFGYEALLQKHFGGSLPALVAWWRDRKAEPARFE